MTSCQAFITTNMECFQVRVDCNQQYIIFHMIMIRHLALWEKSQNLSHLIENVTECKPDGAMSLVLGVTNLDTVVVEEILITFSPRKIALKDASVTFQH